MCFVDDMDQLKPSDLEERFGPMPAQEFDAQSQGYDERSFAGPTDPVDWWNLPANTTAGPSTAEQQPPQEYAPGPIQGPATSPSGGFIVDAVGRVKKVRKPAEPPVDAAQRQAKREAQRQKREQREAQAEDKAQNYQEIQQLYGHLAKGNPKNPKRPGLQVGRKRHNYKPQACRRCNSLECAGCNGE